eukprot:5822752-Lingulodinium_polyedra.AAC.1
MLTDACRRARAADKEHAALARSRAKRWADQAMESSCRGAHAYLRKADSAQHIPVALEAVDGWQELEPIAACEKRAAFWGKWWQARPCEATRLQDAMRELRAMALWEQHRMEPLEEEALVEAIQRARNGRALGSDHWAPAE